MSCDVRAMWELVGGKAPAHWDFTTLEKLLETPKSVSVGVMYPGSDTEGGVPLIKVSDVKNGVLVGKPDFCISAEVDEEYKRTRLNGTELLITLVGNPGDCVLVTKEMKDWNAARALAVVRLKNLELREWLRYVLLSRPAKHIIDARLNTTVQKTLNLKDVKELPIPLPPASERDLITKNIRDIEKKLILNSQTNQTLEEMAQTIFKSWFVDFDPVKAKMNGEHPEGMDAATASLFPDKLVESELGLIPEGWEPKQLKDILELAYGKALKKTDRVEGKVPVYGSGGLTGFHNQSLVEGPGVIVGRKGTVGSVYWEPKAFFPIDTVFYVKPKAGYSLKYCHLVLQNLGLKNMNTDAAVPGLNRNNAYRLGVLTPSPVVLNKFNIIMQSFQCQIDANNVQSTNLSLLRDTLLPELLSGNLLIP
ncbi:MULTISPECIES: restriction endonuclease subunit S [unclassified Pseudoalteromonas]|uniref:restriction endonuclease subunit S n=1 Tax=unclassified Pseudoalteromonas TaxID=194690 RepID=UPI0020985EC2|nr:restriction endonuclease subunit S [Pseudoalteromonas sp. XMcav2-N]MCO7188947.1 restriction endonuclease subunit S [Pseudoalteromonas sp. XMcav2-N]